MVFEREAERLTHAIVRDLCDFVPRDYGFIFNNTRVFKARLFGVKTSGGRIEALITRDTPAGILAQIRGRTHIGTTIAFGKNLRAEVLSFGKSADRYLKFFENGAVIGFDRLAQIAETIGVVPLPPYIRRSAQSEDEERYQSRFARVLGSAAAPTASLHFDDELLAKVRSSYEWAEITLHIGLGTFKAVESADIRDHAMHSERFELSDAAARLIDSDRRLIAIGTSACRSAEHYARAKQLSGECDLFLRPDNPPRRVNALMTNFHLPKSTLIMLIAAMLGTKRVKWLYNEAIAKGYRFYSYGDAMLIL
jgi:S-adenosylmethionine:tRNA ribosyltransferase-isomerase